MRPRLLLALVFLGTASLTAAQTCLTADDMDAATRTALANTAQRYYGMMTQGDVASLRQNSIAGLAGNFTAIEVVVTENKTNLLGVTPAVRPSFLLQAEGTAPLEKAEFLCGVFGASGQTANSAVFQIPNLPPGRYAVVVLDAATAKGPYTVAFVLQEENASWKLGGLYVKAAGAAGHDATWFAQRAADFKSKGQLRNAWLYSLQARELLVPVPFMSTQKTDKLYDEFQSAKPADVPPAELQADAKTFKIANLFLLPVDKEIDLIVKYSYADVSNTTQTYQDNMAVIRAVVAKYPEFRDGFNAVVARAVEPSGRDYGSMLPMKDIK
jgi:hypothetical protein